VQKLVRALLEELQNISQGPFQISVSQCHGTFAPSSMQMTPITDLSEQKHIVIQYPPFTGIHFNFMRFVNKMILKRKHWTIIIFDYT
jgi:hypothetical protein